MGLENRFWAWFKTGLKQVRDLDIQRLESNIGTGIPDVEGCWQGVHFWIELKACDRPARITSLLRYEIKRGQPVWNKRRWRAGGRNFIVIRVGREHLALIYIVEGGRIDNLIKCTEPELAEISIAHGKLSSLDILAHVCHYKHLEF